MISIFLVLLTLFAASSLSAQADPVVAVMGGQIRGRFASDGGAWFKGIPYARPPLGGLRWREPQPVQPWEGVREVAKFSPACTQLSEGWNTRYVTGSAEDCLYINVATPEWPVKTQRPVFVWIHGGSNTAGSGEAAGFDLRTIVHHGLVLVTINYRLGVMGFLAHPELVAESPHHASGNYGLMDQIAALRWVQSNIAKFGGDPGNVTVAGQSAGAFDISLLLTSPLAKGLFKRAIAESGAVTGFKSSMSAARASEIGVKVATILKAPEAGAITFLRTLPVDQLLAIARAVDDRTGLETSVDGWVLPKRPFDVFEEGKSMSVPLIVGSNAQEGDGQGGPRLAAAIQAAYGPLAERADGLYGFGSPAEGKVDPLYGGAGAQWATDTGFRCPATAEAIGHAGGGNVTYQYEFEHPQPGKPATAHSSELNFLFGTWAADIELAEIDRKLSEQMQAYWANFARAGDPNGAGLPPWPKFTPKDQAYLAFTNTGSAAKQGMRRAFCEVFIESLKAPVTAR